MDLWRQISRAQGRRQRVDTTPETRGGSLIAKSAWLRWRRTELDTLGGWLLGDDFLVRRRLDWSPR